MVIWVRRAWPARLRFKVVHAASTYTAQLFCGVGFFDTQWDLSVSKNPQTPTLLLTSSVANTCKCSVCGLQCHRWVCSTANSTCAFMRTRPGSSTCHGAMKSGQNWREPWTPTNQANSQRGTEGGKTKRAIGEKRNKHHLIAPPSHAASEKGLLQLRGEPLTPASRDQKL